MTKFRLYESPEVAKSFVQVFKDRKPELKENIKGWPSHLQHVGTSLAVAYKSDKWKPGKRGDRDWDLYKHLAESENRVYIIPGLLVNYHDPKESWPVTGPLVDFRQFPMPAHYANLGFFEELNLKLFDVTKSQKGSDENIVKVTIGHSYLGASKILWSQGDFSDFGQTEDQPFIFVYTKKDGPQVIITGEELDVKKDGLVG